MFYKEGSKMKKFSRLAIIALFALLVVSLVACNTTPPPDAPGTGGIGDLSQDEVLGGDNIDKNLQAYSKDTETRIYEAYKAGYVEYATFYNDNFVNDGDKPLSTVVPAQGQLGATAKAALGMVRDILRDSYVSEKAVNNLCDYVIEKAPEIRQKAQDTLDKLNEGEGKEGEDEEGYSADAANNLAAIYTKENVQYVVDLYADLVKLTGAEPIARILFEGGLLVTNEIVSDFKDTVSERQAKRDAYLSQIGMSLEDFEAYGEAYREYNDGAYRTEVKLRDERHVPYEREISEAYAKGIITQEQALEYYNELIDIKNEVAAKRDEYRDVKNNYEDTYPSLKDGVSDTSDSGNRPYFYFYSGINRYNKTISYLTAVSDFISDDEAVAALMPDAIKSTMALMQIVPSVAEMYLTANALALDIIDEITDELDNFNAKKQDYIDNFATYKGAIVKMLQSYEQIDTDCLVALADKMVEYYEKGKFALPDDSAGETSLVIGAIAPAINAIKNQGVVSQVFKWCRLAVEATTVEDLDSFDYPTYTNSYQDMYDYAIVSNHDYTNDTYTIYVRKLPERMTYDEGRNAGYFDSDWAMEKPDKTFKGKDEFAQWQEKYSKRYCDYYSNYITYTEGNTMYVRKLSKAMTSSEIDAYVRKLGYSDEYEWAKANPTKKFVKNGEYDTWRNQNKNLLHGNYDSYYDFVGYSDSDDGSSTVYIAMLPYTMTEEESEEFILQYGDDSVDAFFAYFNKSTTQTYTFNNYTEFYEWKTSNNYVYDEYLSLYDYVEYTDSSTSTVYIYVLPERMTSSEISGTRYTDNTWIKRNATKSFVLWKGYAEWKQSNSDLYENVQKYNYLTSSSGYYDSYDAVYYVKLLDKPMSHDELVAANMYNWDKEDADLVIPRFKDYHNWKTSNGYIYGEHEEHYYVNGQEVDQEEYDLARYRMIAKVLQIVLRMTNDNKADFEQFVKDYAKYMDDATDAIDPCYIEFPTAEEVTFDEFYTEFAKIGNIDSKTMTAEKFEEYLDNFNDIAMKYLNYILPKFYHSCGFWY